jgi:hypothetical protein
MRYDVLRHNDVAMDRPGYGYTFVRVGEGQTPEQAVEDALAGYDPDLGRERLTREELANGSFWVVPTDEATVVRVENGKATNDARRTD